MFLLLLMLRYGLCHSAIVDNTELDQDLIHQLMERVNILEANDRIQQQQVQQLLLRDREHQSEIERLLARDRDNQASIAQLKHENQQQYADILRLQGADVNEEAQSNYESPPKPEHPIKLGDGLSTLVKESQRISTRQYPAETPVAFFARLTNFLYHENPNQIIIFDSVITNLGNGYDHQRGIFTAPVNGFYVLSSTVLADRDQKVCVQFVVNGVALAKTCSYAIGGDYDSGAGTIVAQMNQGDTFAVENIYGGGSYYGETISVVNHDVMRTHIGDGGFWQKSGYSGNYLWARETKVAPFDQPFYMILNVTVAGTSGWFPDNWTYNSKKPWNNNSPTEPADFWNGRHDWLPSWQEEHVAM